MDIREEKLLEVVARLTAWFTTDVVDLIMTTGLILREISLGPIPMSYLSSWVLRTTMDTTMIQLVRPGSINQHFSLINEEFSF